MSRYEAKVILQLNPGSDTAAAVVTSVVARLLIKVAGEGYSRHEEVPFTHGPGLARGRTEAFRGRFVRLERDRDAAPAAHSGRA